MDIAMHNLDHFVSGNPIGGPYPDGNETIYLALGCFWGAERLFWRLDGVWVTAVGYQGGSVDNPSYQDVCTGNTGHAEAVLVNFDPNKISLEEILVHFWQEHDPTQGNRQGNDVGSQYRSAIYFTSAEQEEVVQKSFEAYALSLKDSGFGPITTEIRSADKFFFAEEYHQQYLAKNPNGYCGLKGTGISCTIGGA
ncbi:peptide-methionine (S)-S-oxide reductase MsrA [Maritalea porphyrae]|uniref:Peptide methionine sulfoxide reductase MsrA n=1 Tax=Maritalea porphyrae TaxID=880732 RepID=A0ABQ5USE3_9HYPH|nr:peptide-methionine (S)-S-oxide reductase MsrA [Maritalea porphyrae]GLQ17301.1 peptide methionine sulfoxide reductase MsrA [Maritalea porphyrae]